VVRFINRPPSREVEGIAQSVRDKFKWATTIGSIIERFKGLSLGNPKDDILDSPRNAFLVSFHCWQAFCTLLLFLTPEIATDTYEVNSPFGKMFAGSLGPPVKPVVTFKQGTGAEVVPLPDPVFVAAHTACARVGSKFGAAKYWLEHIVDAERKAEMEEEQNLTCQ